MKTKKDDTILYEAHGIMTDGRKLTIQVAGDGKFIVKSKTTKMITRRGRKSSFFGPFTWWMKTLTAPQ